MGCLEETCSNNHHFDSQQKKGADCIKCLSSDVLFCYFAFKKNKYPLGMFTVLIWYGKHKPKLEGKAFQEEE